jgi:phosphatidylglycerol---prolipoprotein diacylglyceryl transferase
MHPLLIKIGPLPIHTYGFMIALGFLTAIFTIRKLAVKEKLDPERIVDLAFYSLLIGFMGTRVLYVMTRWESFQDDLISVFKIWEGGLVFFGGPIAVVPFVIWYFKKHKLPSWKVLDVMCPPLVIAHAFGRLGCLGAGCCYGRPTDSWWGIRLHSELVSPELRGILLHPTQLYESFSLIVLFVGLLILGKRKTFDGQVALTYFMAYPIIRSIIEVFRGDSIRGFIIEDILSTSQFISIFLFLAALFFLLKRLRESEK